jgi:hypothetical protein
MNLYKKWLEQEIRKEHESEHGTTFNGTPVVTLETENGWHIRITGPHTPPENIEAEDTQGDEGLIADFQPFTASMSYFEAEDRLLCSHQIRGNSFHEVKSNAEEYASDQSHIYNPEKRYINGNWVDRKDVPAALVIWKKERDEQFLADKAEYEEWQKNNSH